MGAEGIPWILSQKLMLRYLCGRFSGGVLLLREGTSKEVLPTGVLNTLDRLIIKTNSSCCLISDYITFIFSSDI